MPQKKAQPQKVIDTWALESDTIITLEDLVNAAPFNETSDESGEAATIGTRVPQWMLRRVVRIRELPGSPYEINSDVLRDAMYLGLQILQLRYKLHDWEIEKKLASVIEATGAADRIASQVTELARNLEHLRDDEDSDHAILRLNEFILAIDSIRDEWHRRTLIRMLKRRKIVNELLPMCTSEAKEIML